MKILDKALTKEVAVNAVATAIALVLILSSSRLVRYFSDVAAGELPADLVAALMGYKLLWAVVLIIPVSLFIAIILTLGRWYRDSEMVALAAAGVGDRQLLKTIGLLASVAAVLVGLFSFIWSPWSNEQLAQVEEKAQASDQLQMVRSGQFHRFAGGDRIFYVERVSPEVGAMGNVFVQMKGGDSRSVLVARNARTRVDEEDHGKFLVLFDGHRYDGIPGQADYQMTQYQEYGVRIKNQPVAEKQRNRDAWPTAKLWGSDDIHDRAELQWRLSAPIQTILLALLAVPLSYTSPRAGRGGRLILAVMIYLIYSNMLSVSHSWMRHEQIPAWLGLWWLHLAILLLFMALLRWSRPGTPPLFSRLAK